MRLLFACNKPIPVLQVLQRPSDIQNRKERMLTRMRTSSDIFYRRRVFITTLGPLGMQLP
jgi:hypothetical protein